MRSPSPTSPLIADFPQVAFRSKEAQPTRLTVDVVSGNALPVSWSEVAARYRYPSGTSTVIVSHADVEGRVELITQHDEPPTDVSIWAEGQAGGTYRVVPDMSLVIEL